MWWSWGGESGREVVCNFDNVVLKDLIEHMKGLVLRCDGMGLCPLKGVQRKSKIQNSQSHAQLPK